MKELSELQEHIRTSMIDFHRKLSLPILPRQECMIKSIVIFTYLYEKHYNTGLPDEVYKELIHDGIGLIGPGDGWLTAILHRLFGWATIYQIHMEYYMMLMANFTTDIIVTKDTCTPLMRKKHILG